MTIAVLWFRLYLHVKLEKQHNICFNWKCCSFLPCAEQCRCTERERCVCALGQQDLALARQYQRVWRFGQTLKISKRKINNINIAACTANCAEDTRQSQVTQTCFMIWNNTTHLEHAETKKLIFILGYLFILLRKNDWKSLKYSNVFDMFWP